MRPVLGCAAQDWLLTQYFTSPCRKNLPYKVHIPLVLRWLANKDADCRIVVFSTSSAGPGAISELTDRSMFRGFGYQVPDCTCVGIVVPSCVFIIRLRSRYRIPASLGRCQLQLPDLAAGDCLAASNAGERTAHD